MEMENIDKCIMQHSLTCPPNSVVIHRALGVTPKFFQQSSLKEDKLKSNLGYMLVSWLLDIGITISVQAYMTERSNYIKHRTQKEKLIFLEETIIYEYFLSIITSNCEKVYKQ